MRSIKTFGLALVAVLAVSAVAVASASASGFMAETYPAKLEGKATNTQIFKTESGNVECTEANGKGELKELSTLVLITITYNNCTFATFGKATIEMGTCMYTFHLTSLSAPWKGTTDIDPAGCVIAVKTLTCTVKVPSQTGLSSVEFVTLGSGSTREIETKSTLSGIKYTEESGCLKPGEHSNGTYSGNGKDKALNSLGVQEGTWVE